MHSFPAKTKEKIKTRTLSSLGRRISTGHIWNVDSWNEIKLKQVIKVTFR